ncbi:uncharacterized protein LOC104878305 isoform X2 [Vitis vinifera]|uniref:uncharacterized protein LOC104878305 isoform X2 n=1 Tax=Vitis vinifera TaxID=29760 RepID=UPI002882FDAE|nr:uncharacterized protein LOC104878305 isoform X2 [Vitis vinifera]
MGDPFQSLLEPCHISSSQEDLLRNCPFTRQSHDGSGDDSPDSGGVPVESSGIIMLSLPESTYEETTPQDEFQTPPEEVQPASSAEQRAPAFDRQHEVWVDDDKEGSVAADVSCTDGAATVELGKDSDLGFSGPTSAVKVVAVSNVDGVGASEVSESGVEKCRVLLRGSQEASGNLNINSVSPGNCNTISPQNNQGNEIMLIEDTPVKKKPCFPESEFEDTGGVSGLGEDPMKTDSDVDVTKREGVENGKSNGDVSEGDILQSIVGRDTIRKNIEDLEKFKYIIRSVRNGPPLPPLLSEVPQARRELPLSICGPVEDAARDSVTGNRQQVTVVDVLKILCGECDWNAEETEETDILEIAKRCGMTFPRPRWWPPSDSEDV